MDINSFLMLTLHSVTMCISNIRKRIRQVQAEALKALPVDLGTIKRK